MFEKILQIVHHTPPPFDLSIWDRAQAKQAVLFSLPQAKCKKLWCLAHEFLRTRTIMTVDDLKLNADQRLRIALLATLPILELSLNWYHGLHEVVIYPGAFASTDSWMDETGVMHTQRRALSGEAWDQGLMMLSWEDIEHSTPLDGHQVVIHECAHWLDLQNGIANGFPPLHPGMPIPEWTETFTAAYQAFSNHPWHYHALYPYAAESPAEFFAVASESFFETPRQLAHEWPHMYHLLVDFYKQDPRHRRDLPAHES